MCRRVAALAFIGDSLKGRGGKKEMGANSKKGEMGARYIVREKSKILQVQNQEKGATGKGQGRGSLEKREVLI